MAVIEITAIVLFPGTRNRRIPRISATGTPHAVPGGAGKITLFAGIVTVLDGISYRRRHRGTK
jgi:hypothetical protein